MLCCAHLIDLDLTDFLVFNIYSSYTRTLFMSSPDFNAPPRPEADSECPQCCQDTLGPLLLCQAGGNEITNYGRWFQRVLRGPFYFILFSKF
jgi:hypothetical protein